MKQRHTAAFACLCIGAGIGQALADSNEPADAAAAVHPTIYQSPFAEYRRLGDDKATPWREANETVAGIGGWRAYAREAANAAKAREAAGATRNKSTRPMTPSQPAVTPPVATHKHGG